MAQAQGQPSGLRDATSWRSAAFRLSTWLGLALIVFLWAGTYLYLKLDREKSIEAATDNTSNMAMLLAEQVSRSLKQIDQTIQFVRHSYELDPQGFDLPAWTSSTYFLQDFTVQFSIIGADGMMVATNVDRKAKPIDLSDREHFRVHLNTNRDDLFISKPVLGRVTKKWTIQLTRRISKSDGSFGGVIVASIDPNYLAKFFEEIDLGPNGAVSLVGTDGVIRARGGYRADDTGKSMVGTVWFELLSSGQKGSRLGELVPGTGQRLASFRKLNDFPLIVSVAQSEDDILVGYRETKWIFVTTASALTIALLCVIAIGVAHELRLMRARLAQLESERRVAEKSSELEATLQNTSQGIVMLDRDRKVRVYNPRATELLGLAPGYQIGRRLPSDIDGVLDASDRMTDTVAPIEISLRSDTIVSISRAMMPDEGFLYTITDISQHKRNEAVLADARDRAEAGSRARASFLATMSHEIRTPLNGVIGMTHLLEGCDDEAERQLYVATMRRSAGHLQQIIEDVLDVSKLDADRMTFEYIPFDLADCIATTMSIVEPAISGKPVILLSEIDEDVPPRLMGDPGRLRQVLLNIVGNAVKFTSQGQVSIAVDTITDVRDLRAKMLRIKISDTGIGMAAEDLDKLFKDFSQVDDSITRRFGGTGLGLAISRKLTENMGGEISVKSKLGEGSTFTVLLPMTEATDQQPKSTVSERNKVNTSTGLDLLLAEDSPTNTMVATKLLQKLGHRVTAVVDGVEAIDALAKQSFDAVFMDVMMPRMDGLTATRLIRGSGESFAKVPIIALTAAVLDEDRTKAFAAGVDGFATKPISSDRLKAALDDVFADRDRASMTV